MKRIQHTLGILLAVVAAMCVSMQAASQESVLKGKNILFVYGGWDGHEPRQCMEVLKPWLESEGAVVRLSEDLNVYTDKELMGSIDLVIQTWTMGNITHEQERGLLEAVRGGAGLAGWHGGLCDAFRNSGKMELPIAFGKTISNEPYVTDLAKMPHLLMAGATGTGKSVGLNAVIASLLFKKHPSELKFVMVDPKKVELSLYNKIERHYLAKLPDSDEAIITDVKKVVRTLNSLCIEMDQRYDLLRKAGVRKITEYNDKFIHRQLNPENDHRFLPYIVLVIDEFADLIMTAGKEVEMPICRLAQLARAVGIHLIIATQRPTTNIITGTIKANFPARVAFKVTSGIDSRTILDCSGAQRLIGRGDMLISLSGSDLVRIQCALIETEEIEELADFIGTQRGYPDGFLLPEYLDENEEPNKDFDPKQKDEFFNDAARLVVASQFGSTSLLQRKLQLGYNRAGRIIDQLEAAGIVGPYNGSKAREVLIHDEVQLEEILRNL